LFRLLENMKAKHGILHQDTYNFDESGFMMGVISTGAVVTGREHQGRPKGLQLGSQEWTTVIQGICATGWALCWASRLPSFKQLIRPLRDESHIKESEYSGRGHLQ
jgi:hypothetical protein